MIANDIIDRVHSIASEMRQAIDRFAFGLNDAETIKKINHLADEAISVSDYHDYIFEKCNVIRSHVSSFSSPSKHQKELQEIRNPVSKLENWNPNETLKKPTAHSQNQMS